MKEIGEVRHNQVEILYSEPIESAGDIDDLKIRVNKLLRYFTDNGKKHPDTRLTWLKGEGRLYCIVEFGDYE
jgi:hypothetical protein